MHLVSPKIRKWAFGIAIAVNTVLFPISLLLDDKSLAALNIGSALLCWLGFFIADRDLENQEEKNNG